MSVGRYGKSGQTHREYTAAVRRGNRERARREAQDAIDRAQTRLPAGETVSDAARLQACQTAALGCYRRAMARGDFEAAVDEARPFVERYTEGLSAAQRTRWNTRLLRAQDAHRRVGRDRHRAAMTERQRERRQEARARRDALRGYDDDDNEGTGQ